MEYSGERGAARACENQTLLRQSWAWAVRWLSRVFVVLHELMLRGAAPPTLDSQVLQYTLRIAVYQVPGNTGTLR